MWTTLFSGDRPGLSPARHTGPPWRSPALIAACVVFVGLCATSVRDHGLVGEVAAAWGLRAPPAVLVRTDPPTWADPTRQPTAGDRLGGTVVALDASLVRPLESIAVGSDGPSSGLRLPLAVNTYTGGLPDWPAAVLHQATGSTRLVAAWHAALGLAVIGLMWRVLRLHRAVVGAGAAALWLATDWSFVFYRKVLGGTEIALLIATLLVVRGLWDRRWGGGAAAPWVLAVGIGLGLHAKITFGVFLAAAAVATLATRWDRGAMGAPQAVSRRVMLGAAAIVGVLLLPSLIALIHTATLPDLIRSHDWLGLQVGRALSGIARLFQASEGPGREQSANLLSFLVQPLGFFERSCGATPVESVSLGRLAGFAVVAIGTGLAWCDVRDRRPVPALLRWLSIAVPVATAGLFLANRDLHHLGMLSAVSAMWAGLAVDRVAALVTPPRSARRGVACAVLLLPWGVAGARAALRTDGVLATCHAPIVTRTGQLAVVDLLRRHGVKRVVVADYDLYGALDIDAPDVAVTNGWGIMSTEHGRETLGALLLGGVGGHYLTIRPSAPMIYGMDPTERTLDKIEAERGLSLGLVEQLTHDGAVWARLYRITIEGGAPVE